MVEPMFEVYRKTRPEIPSQDELISGDATFDPSDIEPDKRIRGYQNLMNFLEATEEVETVDHPEYGEIETTVGKFLWREVSSDDAPVQEICSECEITMQTNSEKRISRQRKMHHLTSGC